MNGGRWIMALILAAVSLLGYMGSRQVNPVTGESQHVNLSADQEIALGLQAAPELAQQHGGLSRNRAGQELVDAIGSRLVQRTEAAQSPYRFDFHLLDDDRTINAFALPGGQVFITDALARRLDTEGQLAAVLAHEIGHVVGRHGAEHLAKGRLLQGLGGAAVIAASDPDHPERSMRNQALAVAVTQLVNLRFGRDDELESDHLGLRFMAKAGYDPRAMVRVMEVLAEAGKGRGRQPEFFSTHPNPENRISRIRQEIQEMFPEGMPPGLER